MLDWHETQNGNYICQTNDTTKITVFIDKNGQWRGIKDDHITGLSYSSAEDAMNAIEKGRANFVKFRPGPKTTDWMPAKKGGYYRYHNGKILTARRASSGQWYVTVNGSIILDKWFSSFEAASRHADSLVY